MMFLSAISPNVANFLQWHGVVLTLTLVVVLVAEAIAPALPRWRAYPSLIIMALVLLVILFLFAAPFPLAIRTFLIGVGIVETLLLLVLPALAYIRPRREFPGTRPRIARLRFTLATVSTASLLFFALGIAGTWLNWLTTAQYVVAAGLLGCVASGIALFSLVVRRSIQPDDLVALESDSIKRITETSEELKRLNQARETAQQAIGSLEEQRKQMVFLVQKAGLSLFLHDRRKHYQKLVTDEISANHLLLANLDELKAIDQKLSVLDEEISHDPNVVLLQQIIADARMNPQENLRREGRLAGHRAFSLLLDVVRRATGI